MAFLDRIPYPLLIGLAVFMALAPFVPEPHLLEKLKMLLDGTLTKPVDIFDLFWHLLPAIVLLLKLWRDRSRSDLT
jgi:hypothetical protein